MHQELRYLVNAVSIMSLYFLSRREELTNSTECYVLIALSLERLVFHELQYLFNCLDPSVLGGNILLKIFLVKLVYGKNPIKYSVNQVLY